MTDPAKGLTIILETSQNREHVYAMSDAINAIFDGKPYVPLSAVKE